MELNNLYERVKILEAVMLYLLQQLPLTVRHSDEWQQLHRGRDEGTT